MQWALQAIFVIGCTLLLLTAMSDVSLAQKPPTLDNAVDNWVDGEAAGDSSKILRDIEKSIKLDPDVKKNLKDSLKGFLKSKIKKAMAGSPPSLAMASIIDAIQEGVKNKGRGPCSKAAGSIAWSTVQDIHRGVEGGKEMAVDVFFAVLPGGAASSILKKLEGQLLKEIGKEALNQLRKALEKALDDYLKTYKLETYTKDKTIGGCKNTLVVIWNKAQGTFRYLIAGDCGCKRMSFNGPSKIQLSRWSVRGEGTASWIGEKAEKANAKGAVAKTSLKGNAFTKGDPKIKASCCKEGKPKIGEDPWIFPEEKPKVCIKIEIDALDPRYVKAMEFAKRNHPKTYPAKVKELKAAFDNASCKDRTKALEDMHAFRQAMEDFGRQFRAYPKVRKQIDRAIEQMKKALDQAGEHMLDCGKKHCLLIDPFEPDKDGTYTISRDPIYFTTAVRRHKECVGTLYSFSVTEGYQQTESGLIYEPFLVSVPQPDPAEPSGPSGAQDPEETDEPNEPVTDEPEDEPAPSGTPTPPEEPEQTNPPETDTPGSETPESDVPIAETPTEEPVEEIDLGLVKAQEVVVELALSGEGLTNALEGAVVKLFSEDPDLPLNVADGDNSAEEAKQAALNDPAQYQKDVISGIVDKDGNVALSGAPQEGIFSEDAGNLADLLEEAVLETDLVQEQPNEPKKIAAAEPALANPAPEATKPTVRMQLGDAEPERTMATVALKPDVENPELELSTLLKASGAEDVKVVNQYRIGSTPIYVVGFIPRSYSNAFKVLATSTSTLFVEEDPCRNKESDQPTKGDPLYEGIGLWDQTFDNQWAIKQIGFDRTKDNAWENIDAGKLRPVTVAVIDTGVDWFHPDLPKSVFWHNPDEIPDNGLDDDGNGYEDDVIGWDFVRQTNKPWDRDGHGTFVSGVIGAAQNNGIGISGINPAARIMVLKALDEFGQGHASMVAEAITYAADNGAKIINLSLGGKSITKVEQLAIKYAQQTGVLVVVAAGNSGASVADYGPAGVEGVITVAATDRQDRRAGFSNWGPAIDIAAPGVDVLSLRARQTDLLADIPGVKYEKGEGIVGKDRAYFRASGTSFAAPIVTGTAALILSQNSDLEANQVKRMLLNSAKDIGTRGTDNYTGYGLLNAKQALEADPEFFIESRISGVKVVRKKGKAYLRVIGVADANAFSKASLLIGKDAAPKKWSRVKAPIKQTATQAPLMDLPARIFKGAKQWTIRLITEDASGQKREARFNLKLG